MSAPTIHPHPEYDWQCQKCKFWHPRYREKMALVAAPGGMQAIPLQTAREQLPIGSYITREMSNCFRCSKWERTDAEAYCADFQPVKSF